MAPGAWGDCCQACPLIGSSVRAPPGHVFFLSVCCSLARAPPGYVAPLVGCAQVLPADHVQRLKRQIVFCSSPLFGTLQPRALSQWMDYHLFLLGLDHVFLYDGGGVSLPVLAELARFLDAGLITITDFRDQALYSSWSHAQVSLETPLALTAPVTTSAKPLSPCLPPICSS